MTLIATKADFTPANLVKFSQNIQDDQIEPHIYAVQEDELEARLGSELYNDILTVCSLNNTDDRPELISFINRRVKRFLVVASYHRFMSTHGINITQFGASMTRDPQGTFDQISGQDRATILRQAHNDMNVALTKMTSTPFVFDGIVYGKTDNGATRSQMIRAPKRQTKIERSNPYNSIL